MQQDYKIIVIDNCLFGPEGHSLTVAQSVLTVDAKSEIWANTNSSLKDKRIKKIFPYGNSDAAVAFPSLSYNKKNIFKKFHFSLLVIIKVVFANFIFFKCLNKLPSEKAIYFQTNGSIKNAIGLLFYLFFKKDSYGICYILQNPSRSLALIGRLSSFLNIQNFKFASENIDLCSKVTNITGMNCKTLCFPITVAKLPYTTIKQNEDKKYVVGILGMPRREKGFDLVVKLIKKIYEKNNPRNFKFLIQAPVAAAASEGLASNLQLLVEIEKKSSIIEIIKKPTSPFEHSCLIHKCSFLLIPYRLFSYSKRGSLIPIEGLLHEKPLLMTKGLMVERDLPPLKVASFFEDGNIYSMEEAINELADNYEKYKIEMQEISDDWKKKYSPQTFVSEIFSIFL